MRRRAFLALCLTAATGSTSWAAKRKLTWVCKVQKRNGVIETVVIRAHSEEKAVAKLRDRFPNGRILGVSRRF